MKISALQQAESRLALTRRAMQALLDSGEDPIDFQTHWLDFLVQWKGTYIKVQQAAKDTPAETQWFGGINRTRRADPLLRYLYEARNDGEHGIAPSARHLPPGVQIEFTKDVTTNIRIGFDGKGFPRTVLDENGDEVARFKALLPAESLLLEVTEMDGIKKVQPPTSHLGLPMEPRPIIAATLGLQWLESLVEQAAAKRRPSP